MKVKYLVNPSRRLRRKLAAFSLTEVTVGMGIIGTSMMALFSGFTSGFFTMQMARENLRATQILLEKTETIRLYSWDQVVNTPGFIPANFTAPYDPNSTNSSIIYNGSVQVAPIPSSVLATGYSDEMRMVTISLNWKTGQIDRNRTFTTYIARNGLQNYVY
jgi:type II secretory pathway pseudopilin PulG